MISAEAEAAFERATALHRKGRLEDARLQYLRALELQPRHLGALHLSAVLALQTNSPERAAEFAGRALLVDPNNAAIHLSHADACFQLERYEPAIVGYDRAIAIHPGDAAVHNKRAAALQALRRFEDAIAGYDRAIDIDPNFAPAHFNRGHALRELGRHLQAIESHTRAIAIQPDSAAAHYHRANVHRDLKESDAAIAGYDAAIALDPSLADAHVNRAGMLFDLQRFEAAAASYATAIALGSRVKGLLGVRLHTKMRVCDWSLFETHRAELGARLEQGEPAAHPGHVFTFSGSARLQLRAAVLWQTGESEPAGSPKATPAPMVPLAPTVPPARIRIGYFSADFHNHATAQLMAGLFEHHDRLKFEVTAFSFGPESQDPIRRRLEAAFDVFLDVRDRADREVALLARERQIDIAVDLKGFTRDARPGIFALRAAPVQVSYLGYPGTLGAPYMDYLIADRVLIPPESAQFYSEKIVYLPDSYQVNDAARVIAERVFSRAELGLPETGFVYCCFNNNYKITPATFDGWMRILRQVPGSVLWLLEDNAGAAGNLRAAAEARGVSAARLVFAPRLPVADHLARQRAADLFLDTLPCNAHTTASDALWAGLPLLTCLGESFAGRVAGSLLAAVGLSELITGSQAEYEALAVGLARDSGRLAGIRARLAAQRLTAPLFNTELTTRRLEAAYEALYERHRAGLPPEHLPPPERLAVG